MNKNEQVLRLTTQWIRKIGKKDAINRLISEQDVSIAVADKICNRRYRSVPRDNLAGKLLKEMAKDGISLADEAS